MSEPASRAAQDAASPDPGPHEPPAPGTPRRGVRVAAVLALILVALGWTLGARAASDGTLHDAPLLVVGPEVVTAALVDELKQLDDPTSIDVGGTTDRGDAHAALERGEVVGIVDLDLTGSTDTLVLAGDVSPQRDAALTDAVRTVSGSHDRELAVTTLSPEAPGPSSMSIAFGATVGGYLLVLAISLIWGPVASTLRRAVVRHGAAIGAGLAAGGLAALVWNPGIGLATGLVVIAASVVTLACEALAGLRGLVLAALLLLILPGPLAGAGDPLLLAQPWRFVASWTVPGAGSAAVSSLGAFSAHGIIQPLIVVLGATALSLAVLVGVRGLLGRAESKRTADVAQGDVDARGGRGSVGIGHAWQWQIGALVGVVIVCVALTVTLLAPVEAGPRSPVASLASQGECVSSGGAVESIDDLNRVAEVRGADQMEGGDVGASAVLQDTREIWVFGDTLRSPEAGGERVVRNSMLVVDPDCLRVVIPKAGGAIIPDRSDGVGYWPMSVYVQQLAGFDIVSVSAQRVHTIDKDDPFGFEALGPSIATFLVPVGDVPQLVSVTDIGEDDSATTAPMWGASLTSGEDDWVYLYGTARPEEVDPGSGFSLRVARAKADSLNDASTWDYYDGNGWVAAADAAAELIGAAEGTSQTLSVFNQGDTWYALSKQGELLGDEIAVWTADAPEGPFSPPVPVADLPSDADNGQLRYMPLAHPQLLPEPGSVVVSFSQNSTDLGAVVADPLLYRPRFMRVGLPE